MKFILLGTLPKYQQHPVANHLNNWLEQLHKHDINSLFLTIDRLITEAYVNGYEKGALDAPNIYNSKLNERLKRKEAELDNLNKKIKLRREEIKKIKN